jgi:multidrug resistance efflux pump
MTSQANPHSLLGFPRPPVPQAPAPAMMPKPLPKRPKGRWFLGLILLAVVAGIGYGVWNTFFRYQAYGKVTGRTIKIGPPWQGVVKYLHVREGDRVSQGQVLVTVDSLDLRQRHARLADELQLAQASLHRDAGLLKWQAALNSDRAQQAASQYFEARARVLKEEAQLESLKYQYEQAARLLRSSSISSKEVNVLRINCQGQAQLVKHLNTSLEELKKRAEQTTGLIYKDGELRAGLAEAVSDQLRPDLARIEAAGAEKARAREMIDEGEIRAPVNGVVVRTHHFAGESCKPDEPLLTILEEGSLEVVLYMPQSAENLLAVGAEVDLDVLPYARPARCRVVRIGGQYVPAPPNLERYYWGKDKLLPVYLQPGDEAGGWRGLPLDEVVQLPYRKPSLLIEKKNAPGR